MSETLGQRIKKLREQHGLNQVDLAAKLDLRQPTLSAIEKGKTQPGIETLGKLCVVLETSYNYLIEGKTEKNESEISAVQWLGETAYDRKELLPVVVDKQNNPVIKLVPEFAQAGYLTERNNEKYWDKLPEITLPDYKYQQGHFIGFQVWGESMKNTLQGGDWILCQYVDKLTHIRPNEIYVIITRNDRPIVKRLRPTDNPRVLMCHSDNIDYQAFPIFADQIEEVWRYDTLIRFQPMSLPKNS